MQGGSIVAMMSSLLRYLLRCRHRHLGRPIAPIRKGGVSQGGSYVVCLDCGQEFAYDTCAMQIGEPISRANMSGMVYPPPRGSMAPQAPIHGR